MCESLVGSITPATRQNGGRFVIALVDPGGVNDPLVTAWAAVIVVLGSRRSARLAHATAGTGFASSRALKIIASKAAAGTLLRAGDIIVSLCALQAVSTAHTTNHLTLP